ncbi:hypothetical protein EGT36_03180 [Agrobacterium sp. FDAARGOS_525]|uniref:DUF6074 family protein n=1 Tax=Agrobacterium sp. FDAARGOS_525 TaxID=2420311 RepID=UPI000F68185C|nr:DUF6074 family protein [Agrobacterium sp. FDAARGOS_525]RSC36397.1 hypothetical protein EGT36_03180 [Agrobacterium sp. FDAARGOS_525]
MNTVVCFPVHRQRSEIKRCAGNLDRLHGEAASRYWREEMRHLAARLSAIGMCEAEVSRQALLFTGAVMEEMQRAYAEKNQPSQNGK